jgi:alanine-glyoxylate transaminase/serine-glyoxylate transaminase/serine-pyruvate transaminase
MQNYEAGKPSYFATPSPQLVHALHTTLTQITSVPLADRFAAHRKASQKVKKAITDLGLEQLASKPENQANGMTAIYLPKGLTPPDVLPKYIRFGHMGVSVTDPNRDDIDRALVALKDGLVEAQAAMDLSSR